MPRGRPPVSDKLRLKIIQIFESAPGEKRMTIQDIEDRLALELEDEKNPGKTVWGEDLPSRGTVQNVVNAWRKLPKQIRLHLKPFKWHHLAMVWGGRANARGRPEHAGN